MIDTGGFNMIENNENKWNIGQGGELPTILKVKVKFGSA